MRLNLEEHTYYYTCCNVSGFSLCLQQPHWLLGEMGEGNQRWPGGTPMASIPTSLSRAWRTIGAWGTYLPPLSPVSQFISVLLKKPDKAFLCWIEQLLRAVLRKTMEARCLFKGDIDKESLWHVRSTGDSLVVREMFVTTTMENKGKGMQPITNFEAILARHTIDARPAQIHTYNVKMLKTELAGEPSKLWRNQRSTFVCEQVEFLNAPVYIHKPNISSRIYQGWKLPDWPVLQHWIESIP